MIAAGVLAVAGIAVFAFSLVGTRPTVDPLQPPAGGVINPGKRLIVVGTTSAPMKDLRVTLDGKDVTGAVRGASEGIALNAPRLRDGRVGLHRQRPDGWQHVEVVELHR